MTNYKLLDRLTEPSTYIGLVLAMAGAAVPFLIPPDLWAKILGMGLPIVGTALALIPQTASVTEAEGMVLTLLRTFDADISPTYQLALTPVLNMLAAKLAAPAPDPAPATVAVIPAAPPPATPSVPATGVVASMVGMFMLLVAGFGLAACTVTPSDVSTLETSLTAAENLGLAYAALPNCTGSNGPVCSDPAVIADIKTADNAAYAALTALQNGTGTEAELQAAIAALTALIPAAITPSPSPTVTPAPASTAGASE